MSDYRVTDNDLPALYQAADPASSRGQELYVGITLVSLALMIIGAAFTSTSPEYFSKRMGAIISVALFALSLVATFILKFAGWDKRWYGGRALAESVKTLSWKYMVKAHPYGPDMSEAEADRQFLHDLGTLASQRTQLFGSLGGSIAAGPQISPKMRTIRSSDTSTRKEAYLIWRIADQKTWYANRSATNRNSANWLLAGLAICQVCGLLWGVIRINAVGNVPNLTGIFAALASASVAWSHLRQNSELARSYGLAAHELGLIADEGPHIETDSELESFVMNAEKAISREHTMWVARRDRS